MLDKNLHLAGFIIRNLTRCTVTWTSNFPSCLFRSWDSVAASQNVRGFTV